MGAGKGYAVAFGGVDIPEFMIRKSANSDHYAIINYNTFASETNNRIEVIHYDGEHKVLQQKFISAPSNQYKYTNLLDIVVRGANAVEVLIYAYNTPSKGKEEGDLMMVQLENSNLQYTSLKTGRTNKATDGIIVHNTIHNKLYVMSQALLNTKSNALTGRTTSTYGILRFEVDVKTRQVKETNLVYGDQVDATVQSLFGKKEFYSGILQNVFMTKNGHHNVVLEGFETVTVRNGNMMSEKYILRDILCLEYDSQFNLVHETYVPRSHNLNNSILLGGGGVWYGPLEHYKRLHAGAAMKGGNQYKSFAYVSGAKDRYLLLNDIDKNEEQIQKGKVIMIQSVDDCDLFAFNASGAIQPKRQAVFSNTSNVKNYHSIAALGTSDINLESGEMATLRLVRNGKEKKAQIVWLNIP